MFLIKRNPWGGNRGHEAQKDALAQRDNPLSLFHNEVDRLFNNGFFTLWPVFAGPGEKESQEGTFLTPRMDIHGDDKEYRVTLELPGVTEKDINIEIRDDNLIVSGEKKSEREAKDEGKEGGSSYSRVERVYGSFRRVLGLPEDIDPDAVKAVFKDGVLDIAIPRKEVKKELSKKIAISAG